VGTESYMAPEVHLKQPYRGESADLFAAAVILFSMVSGHYPFEKATQFDKNYRCIAQKRPDIFWKSHCKNKAEGFYSENFKHLIT